eukprot:gene17390-biopygen2323
MHNRRAAVRTVGVRDAEPSSLAAPASRAELVAELHAAGRLRRLGETSLRPSCTRAAVPTTPASGPRPVRFRFFEFCRAARVLSASAAVSPCRPLAPASSVRSTLPPKGLTKAAGTGWRGGRMGKTPPRWGQRRPYSNVWGALDVKRCNQLGTAARVQDGRRDVSPRRRRRPAACSSATSSARLAGAARLLGSASRTPTVRTAALRLCMPGVRGGWE